MTPKYAIKAAIGDMQAGRSKPHCGPAFATDASEINWAPHYCEPGYTNPENAVVFANWNRFPTRLTDILERMGCGIEWEDEWDTCDECMGAIRTSPDSYSWLQSYVQYDDGDRVCLECMDWPDYLRSIEDNSGKAAPTSVNPAEYGYVRLSESGEYASGFHTGQNDDPREILAKAHAAGLSHVLFRLTGKGQFDISFETWIREGGVDD